MLKENGLSGSSAMCLFALENRYKMFELVATSLLCVLVLAGSGTAFAQTNYRVISVADGGTITGTVKWSGTAPRALTFPLNKDVGVCDPESRKRVDLERLEIGTEGGVANTVVFLKNVSSGKAMDIPQRRRFLNQKHCRYEPHILLVPENGELQMTSSDPVLHTIHMEGAATYNLPFPFPDRPISRPMPHAGLVTLKCNGGHLWMNAVLFVVDNPYYTVTDEQGNFELGGVPPGKYEIVAWHEGWHVVGQQASFDVSTSAKVDRPLFSDPKTWQKEVAVDSHGTTEVNFVIAEK